MSEAKKTGKEKGISAIKEQLLKRKIEIEQELKRLIQDKFSDDQVQDVGDQALSSTMESLNSSLQHAKMEEYKRIDMALNMIEDGTYGICVDCGQSISEKRLNSFPNATRCLSCQEIYEESGPEKFD